MAELATMFYVNGWAQSMFPQLLAWTQAQLPQSPFGDVNHSANFVHEFLPSLTFATQTCVAADLHSIIPALGLPSLLSRVIDVVSVNGQSLLSTIHIYTNTKGMISWALLGCQCLEASALDDDDSMHAANGTSEIFGFHKAKRMVGIVHASETISHQS